MDFTLPGKPWAAGYQLVIDTTEVGGEPAGSQPVPGGQPHTLPARSVLLLRSYQETG